MSIVAWFVFGFAVMQLLVALANLLFRQPLPQPDADFQPLVSILIPARNEEQNITRLLKDIQTQSYKNIEVLVYNDQSEDQTAAIVQKFVAEDKRIKLINAEGLPDGWLGKNHACHRLAEKAKGEYYLFLDADVRISGEIIHQTVSMVRKHRLGLLTIFPRQLMKTWGEWLVVPSMNFILLSLLPLILVRLSGFASLSAANGQFMLFDAQTYKQQQPHEKHRLIRVEDISIARSFKKADIRIACLTGTNEIRCRMYSGFDNAVQGLSRSVIMFFGNSTIITLLFWAVSTLGFLFVWFLLPLDIFVIYVLILLFTRVFISVASRQNIFKNLVLGFFQQWVLGYVIFIAIRSQMQSKFEWKGRQV
ncbi:glycosyltransferase [Maribellus sediminis]|uniref:glycosyltransferase n=1 Tax=Maribellus sediminis TaxID=2696285 RepID=UPI0014314C80|nr:glycosyltransferase family 2 protein [Maribellus sediminis]